MTDGALLIDVEDDPTPIVLIMAATLRRAARDPKLAAAMRGAKGNVAMKSSVDPQAATIRFHKGHVHVVRGVAKDASVTIEADINKMSDVNPPKPKVSGAARHLRLALLAAKVLEPPHGTWQEEATLFWNFAAQHAGCPRGLRIVCTDDGTEVSLGETIEYELHGSEHAILNVVCGNTVLGQDILDGKLCVVGALRHTAQLTGRSLAWMMGGQ